jgi:hypothetical protein
LRRGTLKSLTVRKTNRNAAPPNNTARSVAAASTTSRFSEGREVQRVQQRKVANSKVWPGRQRMVLNDGQIPNVRGVHLKVSTGYNPVEGQL